MHTEESRPGLHRRRAFAFPEAGHVTTSEIAGRLRELAAIARRLPPPNHRNPDAL